MSKKQHARAAQKRAQDLGSRREYVAALEEEKRGYQVRGLKERVKLVDAQIAEAKKGLDDDGEDQEEQTSPPPPAPAGNRSAKDALRDGVFDPSEHDVKDVIAYLEGADVTAEEFERVQKAEAEGKKRSTIADWKQKAPAGTDPAGGNPAE